MRCVHALFPSLCWGRMLNKYLLEVHIGRKSNIKQVSKKTRSSSSFSKLICKDSWFQNVWDPLRVWRAVSSAWFVKMTTKKVLKLTEVLFSPYLVKTICWFIIKSDPNRPMLEGYYEHYITLKYQVLDFRLLCPMGECKKHTKNFFAPWESVKKHTKKIFCPLGKCKKHTKNILCPLGECKKHTNKLLCPMAECKKHTKKLLCPTGEENTRWPLSAIIH